MAYISWSILLLRLCTCSAYCKHTHKYLHLIQGWAWYCRRSSDTLTIFTCCAGSAYSKYILTQTHLAQVWARHCRQRSNSRGLDARILSLYSLFSHYCVQGYAYSRASRPILVSLIPYRALLCRYVSPSLIVNTRIHLFTSVSPMVDIPTCSCIYIYVYMA